MGYQSYVKGKSAEDLAADFVESHGYQIIERNFRCSGGEIDIIAQEGKMLVFVEVRLRRIEDETHPLETITCSKQKRLINTAQMYLAKNNTQCLQCRFDVVAITEENGQSKIEIFQNMIEG